ncbi:MAG TPA: hypothetical protein VN607_05930 [Gemmatimonadaceae bacterium]|nr:hypothetical protein [Gemmatimonadaceae bacterium]
MQKPWTVLASFTAATLVLSLSVLTACGSSTGPSAPSFNEARHLDTLAQQAAAASEFDRFRVLQYPVALLAHGVSPETVTVSVNGTDQSFEVGALELVGTTAGKTPTPNDSAFVLVAWQGTDASQVIYLVADVQGDVIDEALLQDTTPNFALTSATVDVGLSSSVGACPTLNLASPSNLINAKCTKAKVTGDFDLTFADPQSDGSLHYVLASQSIPAVRLLLTASNGGQDIITRIGRPTTR